MAIRSFILGAFVLLFFPEFLFSVQSSFDTWTGDYAGPAFSIASADLDGDGDQDLVATNGQGVSVLKNDGNGTFGNRVDYPSGQNPRSVFVADLNGDGYPDLTVANYGSNTVSVLKNKGDGTFETKVDYATGDEPSSVFSSDLDGDGDLDLAVVNNSGLNSSVSVLKNNGNGTFEGKVDYNTSGYPTSVFAADLDVDGDQDIALSIFSGVLVMKNNGDGTFGPAMAYNTESIAPASVVAADFDRDGDMDLAVPDGSGRAIVSILLNNGNGTFAPSLELESGAYYSQAISVSDFNGDGYQDLVVANTDREDRRQSTVSFLRNNGDGTFAEPVIYGTGSAPISIIASDFDGDGNTDLVTANYSTATFSVLKNNGNGTFPGKADYPSAYMPTSVFGADLDGDRDLDLVVANSLGSPISVFKNDGTGAFHERVDYAAGISPQSVIASDLDGDGDKDLVAANYAFCPLPGGCFTGSNSVSVFKNAGDGSFPEKTDYPVGNYPRSVVSSDLDGDGDADLVVANSGNGIPFSEFSDSTITILKNSGDGSFFDRVDYVVGNSPSSVIASDLDGDGDPDLAVTIYGSYFFPGRTVSILKNNGDGTFTSKVDYQTGNNPFSVSASDLDGDGYPDLAVLGRSISILRNNGDGSFAPKIDYPGVDTWDVGTSVFASDLDGDGDRDLAMAGGTNFIYVLINDGNGEFGTKVNYGTGSYPISVFAADLDGDGDQDLAAANYFSHDISILKNLTGPYYSRGDMDGDGNLTVSDVVFMLNCVFLGSGLCNLRFADLNCDGNLTSSDVILELNAVFLGTPFPCQ